GGPNATLGCADLIFPFEDLPLSIEFSMVRKNQVSGFAEEKITIEFDSELSQALHFLDQAHRIHDDAVADNTNFFRTENAGRHKVQNIFLSFNVDGVAGVIAALGAHNDIGILRQHINDFAFAFIAP